MTLLQTGTMRNCYIFQCCPVTIGNPSGTVFGWRLSLAIPHMRQNGIPTVEMGIPLRAKIVTLEKKLKPSRRDLMPERSSLLYLWESRDIDNGTPGHLVAKGVVTSHKRTGTAPDWMEQFCTFDKPLPHNHIPIPRFSVEIIEWDVRSGGVRRDGPNGTGSNPILNKNPFLKIPKTGFYQGTLFQIREEEAKELDKLSGWK